MTNVERYRELCKFLAYKFKGIELSHIVALKIWGEAREKKIFTWHHLVYLFKAYDVRKLKLPEHNGFLATYMEEWRKDHYTLYNNVLSKLKDTPERNDLFNLKKHFAFHPLVIIKLLYHFFFALKRSRLSFEQKLNWFSEYVFLCNTIVELRTIDFSKVTKYLSMCHVLGLENLLTQFFRQQGIITFSLEEGIYIIYKKNFIIGAIAYELFETDHLLCWGQFTKDQYIEFGIDKNRIDVAGYPKSQELKHQRQDNQYKKCLVMLAGPVFGDVNMNLLSLLDTLKGEFDVVLKSHPVNYSEMEKYAKSHSLSIVPKQQTIADCFINGEYDFCIAVNTTAYYESWMAGIPCVRYYDNRFDNFNGFNDFFSNRDELICLINEYRKKPKNDREICSMLEYSIGFGIDNYDSILSVDR